MLIGEAYKEDKCFKIIEKAGLRSFEDVEKTCHQQENSTRLISIRFQEEQEFITNLLKTNKIADNALIGLKYDCFLFSIAFIFSIFMIWSKASSCKTHQLNIWMDANALKHEYTWTHSRNNTWENP